MLPLALVLALPLCGPAAAQASPAREIASRLATVRQAQRQLAQVPVEFAGAILMSPANGTTETEAALRAVAEREAKARRRQSDALRELDEARTRRAGAPEGLVPVLREVEAIARQEESLCRDLLAEAGLHRRYIARKVHSLRERRQILETRRRMLGEEERLLVRQSGLLGKQL